GCRLSRTVPAQKAEYPTRFDVQVECVKCTHPPLPPKPGLVILRKPVYFNNVIHTKAVSEFWNPGRSSSRMRRVRERTARPEGLPVRRVRLSKNPGRGEARPCEVPERSRGVLPDIARCCF